MSGRVQLAGRGLRKGVGWAVSRSSGTLARQTVASAVGMENELPGTGVRMVTRIAVWPGSGHSIFWA